MFPRLKNRISETKVYRNENTYFCKKLGIPKQAGGLFLIKASTIVVCYNNKHDDDIVIVHELLHYSSQLMGSRFRNEDQEEDFAYLNSIPYMVRKYDKKWIVENYLLAYYWSREQREMLKGKEVKKLTSSEKRAAREKALCKCNSLFDGMLTGFLPPEDREDEELGRFSFI